MAGARPGTRAEYRSQGKRRLPCAGRRPTSAVGSRSAWEPMGRSTVSSKWYKAALEDAGLRHMPLNALRHTAAASRLLSG